LREFVSRGETERRPENLPKLIEEASALALVGAKPSEVRVSFGFDPDAGFVLADKIQIQQVLLNLIRNAIEAMQESPRRELRITTHALNEAERENLRHRLHITTRILDDGIVEVSVIDTGPGIADAVAAQLFQPFVSTKSQGMGVGLSVSRTIIESHGGKLWAEPNPEGGTAFRFTLKAVQPGEFTDGGG
jgi:two-component system sensor kinase FixL